MSLGCRSKFQIYSVLLSRLVLAKKKNNAQVLYINLCSCYLQDQVFFYDLILSKSSANSLILVFLSQQQSIIFRQKLFCMKAQRFCALRYN